jgi:thymidylate kinase
MGIDRKPQAQMNTPPPQRPQPLAIANTLREALTAAGIRFVHWKSNDHLAEALAGLTDIDLYIAPADKAGFDAVMARLPAIQMTGQPWSRYPGVEDWLLFDEATGGFLHLHHHYALMTGLKRVKHLAIPWGAKLLETARIHDPSGWPIPATEMEFTVLLVRIWAKMPPWRRLAAPRIPASIRRELEWLRSEAKAEKLTALLSQLLPGVAQAPVLAVLESTALQTSQIIAAAKLLNRALVNSHRMGWPQALAQATSRNAAMALRRGFRPFASRAQVGKTLPGGGLVVALVGSDGAGKSTVTTALTRWLRFKLDTECLYLGTGDGGAHPVDVLRRGIRGLARRFKASKPTSSAEDKESKKPASTGQRIVALHHLLLLRHKLMRLRLAHRLAKAGRMVILDRFPQDQFAGLSDGPRLQDGESFSWAARSEQRIYMKIKALSPDLVIRLEIDADTAKARKPDHDREILARKAAIVSALKFPDAQVVTIDARQPLDMVLLTAKRAIWHALLEKNP